VLDEPIDWANGDKEALLDYAFDHLRITALNEAMCRQYGEPRERLIGSVPRDRWSNDVELWRAHVRRLYDQGRSITRCARRPADRRATSKARTRAPTTARAGSPATTARSAT
jgi:PAS domain-containing protein